ncbi:MAG: WG repeat-containing protein, partial [Bacteroidota bacterium]
MELIAANQSITLSSETLGQGGEGTIYQVLSPPSLQNSVAKIYHPRERNKGREYKLNYLISHPVQVSQVGAHVWPQEIIYNESGAFMGFLMPKAKSKYDLTVLSSLKLSSRLEPEWLEKYHREGIKGFENRAQVAFYLAQAMADLHASQHYRLVDFKPENVRVSLNGKVNLLDMDSLQIHQDQEILFKALKVTAEYSPAEIKYVNLGQDLIPEYWDRFSLAVVIYKLLFGLHPFSGTPKGEYQVLSSQAQKIQAGLFPLGKHKSSFEVIPLPHQNFNALPASVQRLFLRCFEEGFREMEARPAAQEWAQELENFSAQTQGYQNPIPQKVLPPPSVPEPSKVKPKTSPWPLIIVALVCLSFLYFGTANRFDFFDRGVAKKPKALRDSPRLLQYKEGRLPFQSWENDKYGFLDEKRDTIVPAIYDEVKPFSYARAFVKSDFLWGVIDRDGQQIVPPRFDDIKAFDQGTAIVLMVNKWSLIDTSGNTIIPPQYDFIKRHDEPNLIITYHNFKYQLFNSKGTLLNEDSWESMRPHTDSYTLVEKDDQKGLLSPLGDVIIRAAYDEIGEVASNCIRVAKDAKFGYYNTDGN